MCNVYNETESKEIVIRLKKELESQKKKWKSRR